MEKNLAKHISGFVSSYLGLSNRGEKEVTDKGECNYTSMDAVIIEPFFCDNEYDCSKYRSRNSQGLANIISQAILSTI